MSEVKSYNVGHGGQQVIKAPNGTNAPADAGKRVEGKDLRAGK